MPTPNNYTQYNDITIIKLSSLGDVIHTLPAYSALRNHFPHKNIAWVIEEKGKSILDLVPGINRTIIFNIKNKPLLTWNFWSSLHNLRSNIKNRKSITLDFQGLIKSGLISYLTKAEKRIGFHRKNLKEPAASLFYTDHLLPRSENTHVIQKNLALLSKLGIIEKRWDFPLHISEELIQSTLTKLKKKGISVNQNAVVFNIGGAWKTKRWFPDSWIELIELLDLTNLSPLILWGNSEEGNTANKISQKTGVPLVPFLSVKEVFALIHESILVVSGDSFPLQAASALSIPVVGLFGPTNPKRNGPFNKKDKIAFHPIDCSFCYKHMCDKLECMKKIKPDEVARLCKKILS